MSTPEPARPHYYVPSTAHPVVGGPGADLSHDEAIAALGALDVAYAQSPAAPQGDTADVDRDELGLSLAEHWARQGIVEMSDSDPDQFEDDDTIVFRAYRSAVDFILSRLSAAGLLAASPAPDSPDLEALAGVCRAYVSAWDDRHADATILGSLARRVAVSASPAAPQAADEDLAWERDQRAQDCQRVRDALLPLLPDLAEQGKSATLRAGYVAGEAAEEITRLRERSAPAPADDEAGFDRTAAHCEAAADRADDEAAQVERVAHAMYDRDRAEGISPFTFEWDEHEQHGKVQMRYEVLAVAALAALKEGQKA